MDSNNSGMFRLYHIEFNRSPSLSFLFVGALLSYANHIELACNVCFLAFEIGKRPRKSIKRNNECDNVTEARKERNSIINSNTDCGKETQTKGDNNKNI